MLSISTPDIVEHFVTLFLKLSCHFTALYTKAALNPGLETLDYGHDLFRNIGSILADNNTFMNNKPNQTSDDQYRYNDGNNSRKRTYKMKLSL